MNMPNMNGIYPLSSTPHGNVSKFPKAFSEYGRGVQSFDVYSPLISQLYSQVFWKGLPPVDLPESIVSQFKGKGMAVVGFEMDQVRRIKEKDGTKLKDIAVPINIVYNHHFESIMIGEKKKFQKIYFSGPNDPRLVKLQQEHHRNGHGLASHESRWMIVDNEKKNNEKNISSSSSSSSSLPTSQAFGGANGGEYRLSYHGYAPGYVQVIESPTKFQITPMQIDTWNRDEMNLTGPTKFVPGPVPRSSLAPLTGSDAMYSGLLECPLTTRVSKNIQTTYVTCNGHDQHDQHKATTSCVQPIQSIEECVSAVTSVLGNSTRVVMRPTTARQQEEYPVGCSAMSDNNDASIAHISYVPLSSTSKHASCGEGTKDVRGTTMSLVNVSMRVSKGVVFLDVSGPSDVWFGVGLNATAMKDEPWAIIMEGGRNGTISERRLHDQNPGKIFYAQHLFSSKYIYIILLFENVPFDRFLQIFVTFFGNFLLLFFIGNLLNKTITVLSITVINNVKHVSMTRPLNNGYSNIDPTITVLPFINAIGSQPTLSYHKVHAPSFLTLLPVANESENEHEHEHENKNAAGGTCVCEGAKVPFGQGQGTLTYTANASQPMDVGHGTVSFVNKCPLQPRSDLLLQKNPTCDSRTYVGGQIGQFFFF